jgi:HK97 gp10 family phage protein
VTMMRVSITGIKQVVNQFTAMGGRADREAQKALEAAALIVRNDAVKSIQKGPKSGRLYVRGVARKGRRKKTMHQASAPGQAPATDTGMLASNITFYGRAGRRPAAYVEAQMHYSRDLESGTRKMAARPFMRPALARNKAKVLDLVRQAAAKTAKGARRK